MNNLDKILIPRTVGSANHDKVRQVSNIISKIKFMIMIYVLQLYVAKELRTEAD